jgi:hypothetical protein
MMTTTEKIPLNEAQLIEEMTFILKEKMQKDYENQSVLRDAHPKHLALVKAEFIVESSLPEKAKAGIFKTPKKYNCLIRLSSASGKVQSDAIKDFRGFALKIYDVEGNFINQSSKPTQDFLLMSYPVMPLGTVKMFRDAVFYSIKRHPSLLALKFLLTGKGSVLKALKDGKRNHTSPLDIGYWSTTPYHLGKGIVKYKIVPTSSYKSTLPVPLTENYLSENIVNHLDHSEASFDFMIQFFKNESTTPIENASIEWKESDSPFIKVATIKIAPQQFKTKQRSELAEHLAFSPFNALVEHKPIGGINRARAIIYQRLSDFRAEMNKISREEYTTIDFNSIK